MLREMHAAIYDFYSVAIPIHLWFVPSTPCQCQSNCFTLDAILWVHLHPRQSLPTVWPQVSGYQDIHFDNLASCDWHSDASPDIPTIVTWMNRNLRSSIAPIENDFRENIRVECTLPPKSHWSHSSYLDFFPQSHHSAHAGTSPLIFAESKLRAQPHEPILNSAT